MNTISGLSFYDSLNKLTVGWLIIFPFLIDAGLAFNNPIAHVAAFLVGTIYQCSIQQYTKCLRNRLSMIKKQNKWMTEDERKNMITKCQYYKAYYKVARAGILLNIPVLEAIEDFIRNIFFIAIFYIVGFAAECPNFCSLLYGIGTPCRCAIFLTIIVFMLIPTWYYVQNKIFELVWEGAYFIDELNKKKQE